MKKFKIDKKYLTISIYVLLVIVCAISFEKILTHADSIVITISELFKTLQRILAPFIYGFAMAYLLNPAVRSLENFFQKHIKALREKPRLLRTISVALTFVLVLGAVIWIILYLVPEVIASFTNLITNLTSINIYSYDNEIFAMILPTINETFGLDYTYRDIVNIVFQPLMTMLSNLPGVLEKILTGTVNAANLVLNLVMGLMIAFYMIIDKETFQRVSEKFLKTIFKKSNAEKIVYVAKTSNNMFEKFFIGKIIDSTIIGILFFIICLFLKPPYSVLLSLIIGVTNIIPYFGPFIGAVPVIIIILLSGNFMGVIWMAIAIFILQQFDGIVLGPKILGDSIGLKPLDVIFAIIVGGALFGVLGMFLGVPFYAVIKNMVSAIINREYDKKYLINSKEKSDADEIS